MTTLTIDQLKENRESIIKAATYRIGATGVKPVMKRLADLAANNDWLKNYKSNTIKQLTEEVIKMVIKFHEFEVENTDEAHYEMLQNNAKKNLPSSMR